MDAVEGGYDRIVTYGGAFSNHLVAVACSTHLLGMRSKGIIRSYGKDLFNPSIALLKNYGMELEIVPPPEYEVLKGRKSKNRDSGTEYFIPEGGTNERALHGIQEMVYEIENHDQEFTHYVLVAGTGGTFAGIIKYAGPGIHKMGISPFKGAITSLPGLSLIESKSFDNWSIVPSCITSRFGGYNQHLVDFISDFHDETDVLLDPIYTAKGMLTIRAMIEEGKIGSKANVLFIHTGGLQGNEGFNKRFGTHLPLQQKS